MSQQQEGAAPSKIIPFCDLPSSKKKYNVRDSIRAALGNTKVCADIAPYITNGTVRGHKVLDQRAALGVILIFDRDHGTKMLADAGFTEYALIQQLNTVLRERYTLNKSWKAVEANPKTKALMVTPTDGDAA